MKKLILLTSLFMSIYNLSGCTNVEGEDDIDVFIPKNEEEQVAY